MSITLPAPTPISASPTTHIAIAIDSSGSMANLSNEVVDNFNAIVKGLSEAATKLGQQVFVSLLTFGERVDVLFDHRPIAQVPTLTILNYRAMGGTPMLEACWRAVTGLQGHDGKDVANLLTVLTDGEENSSNWQAKEAFLGSIKGLLGTDRWTITFSVPRGFKNNITRLGISAGNVQEWDTTSKGLEVATQNLSSSYSSYLGLRSTGATSSKGFFTATVDATAAKAAKQKLDDVANAFKEMTVRTQDPKTIQDFIEARGHSFQKGRAFYQLTKAEKVQTNKEVLLREIKSGAIYGGSQARNILGLPNTDVKVKPDDTSTWDIFVQSTSNNRKLMVGTNLLYLK